MSSDISGVLGASAPAYHVEHKGRRYGCSPLTWGVMAEYEKWLKQQAVSVLEGLPPEHFQAGLRAITDDAVKGVYSFHGEVAKKSLETPAGMITLGRIMFGASEQDFMDLIQSRSGEVQALVKLAFEESKPRGHAGNA